MLDVAQAIVILVLGSIVLFYLRMRRDKAGHARPPTKPSAQPKQDTVGKVQSVRLIPLQGVGLLSFGDDINSIRAVLGPEKQVLNRQNGKTIEYVFDKLACIIEVDDDRGIVAFQFFPPAMPCLDGENLLELPFAALARKLAEMDKTTVRVGGGIIRSPRWGIAARAADAENAPHEPADLILLTCKDYWRDQN